MTTPTPTPALDAAATPAAATSITHAWQTPVYVRDIPDGTRHNDRLAAMILEHEKHDPDAANFGGIDAIKSCEDILLWHDPAITWLQQQILHAVDSLTHAVLGTAAREISAGILAEAWAVTYQSGGSLRPHTHHDSCWSGVFYVDNPPGHHTGDAGYLQLLDPRPGAVARQASHPPLQIAPIPGRM
ncbi:putative 2OG-Fe(II) oxygenase, partial [Actinomadura kijaniata]|uniref:putative 2OG-Fe(II) oxygenase n=1 Tax=Actinomadura kijaniata TaxID=46161 RepID=UPI003F1ADBC8